MDGYSGVSKQDRATGNASARNSSKESQLRGKEGGTHALVFSTRTEGTLHPGSFTHFPICSKERMGPGPLHR